MSNPAKQAARPYKVWCAMMLLAVLAPFASAQSKQPAALGSIGLYDLRETSPDLTGRDITIAAVCRSLTYIAGQPQDDYQLNTAHACFLGSEILFPDPFTLSGGVSDHATAIGGILIGRDENASTPDLGPFLYEGIAPQANLHVYEFWRFIRNHVLDNQPIDAAVLTLSVGIPYEDWWTRGIQRIAERDSILIVAGIGNGADVSDPLLYPAAGANIIAVGVVDAALSPDGHSLDRFSLPYAAHSSAGPTADRRCKPDLVAPSNCLIPNADSEDGYHPAGNWTSFSTPIVSGSAALLLQKAQADPVMAEAIRADGGNNVIRAILMNSAAKLPFWHKGRPDPSDDHESPLDYLQGAGMLDMKTAMDQLMAGPGDGEGNKSAGWDSFPIERSGLFEMYYDLTVGPEDRFIEATLVWNRHFRDEYPFEAIPDADSDLRLEIRAIDPDNPDRPIVIDYSDSTQDNVEHIHCPVLAGYSRYQIVVSCKQATGEQLQAGRESEPFALAWRTTDRFYAESQWWNDLNADGTIDDLDRLAYSAFERFAGLLDGKNWTSKMLKLTPERIELLKAHWNRWKPFLTLDSETTELTTR
ncbi:MAG: S8 family serine peptidase [Sedimentisphaerales bacterium]|nr:S8 family serine peptidase [Sedimentisphaerales bacterium]